jgi:hypothetical protein
MKTSENKRSSENLAEQGGSGKQLRLSVDQPLKAGDYKFRIQEIQEADDSVSVGLTVV